ncbi:MAG: zinc-dependent alcohol dehydrogenase family protein [Bacteroidales bacterium]|nr:zinc-dependent alcohol dehydrogenase family protein [Bacteroidales bacterium]
MLAVRFEKSGTPTEVLQVQDIPKPTPARGEVLVRMIASPINPSDVMYVEGRYGLKPTLPATPGFEGVGIVESSGGGLLGRFRVGKRVAVLGSRTGGWAEYAVASAKQVFPIPDAVPDDQAAAFFVNPATAFLITTKVLAVPRGEWLLQTAAGSQLGRMVILLGKKFGFRTINVVRRREQVAELQKLGADVVLVSDDGPLAEQVRAVTGQPGVRYAMDPVGGTVGTAALEALAQGGTLIVYGALSNAPIQADPRFLITGSKVVRGFWLSDWAQSATILQKLRLMRTVRQLLADGVIRTEVGTTFPLSQITEAVRAATTDGKAGKVLLRIGISGANPTETSR